MAADQSQSGVASLLSDQSRVLFQSIFDTRQIGRISDLLVAELDQASLDELRLRLVLLVTVCLIREYEPTAEVPLTLECGSDAEWIAVGLEFQAPSGLLAQLDGVHDRLIERKPLHLFDEGLQLLFSVASRLYVRRFGETGRIEVISMIPRHAIAEDVPALRNPQAEFLFANIGEVTERKQPAEFVELGDLNYTALLEAKASAQDASARTAGAALARLGGGSERDGRSTVKGGAESPGDERRVRGVTDHDDSGRSRVAGSEFDEDGNRRVLGTTDHDDSSRSRVSGGDQESDAERRIRGVTDRDDSTQTRVGGGPAEEDGITRLLGGKDANDLDETRIGGTTENSDDRVRVRGTTERMGEGVTRIKGGSSDSGDDGSSDVTVVSGGGDSSRRSSWARGSGGAGGIDGSPEEVSALQDRIRSLERQLEIAQREGRGGNSSRTRSAPFFGGPNSGSEFPEAEGFSGENEDQGAAPSRGVKRLLKKLWPFGKDKRDPQSPPPLLEVGGPSNALATDPNTLQFAAEGGTGTSAPPAETPAGAAPAGSAVAAGAAPGEPTAPQAPPVDPDQSPESVAAKLLVEIDQGQIQKTISRAREEADDLKSEEENPRLKRWADRLVGELLTEKARLFAMAKKLNTSIKQKELDFQRKEQALQRELSKAEEQLRQKNAAMEHMKTQLAQSLSNAAKQGTRGSAALPAEENQLKQKLMQATRTSQTLKDENKNLNDKVIELQAKVSGLQAAVKTAKPGGDSGPVQARLDRALKTVEEFKRSNQVLMERLAEAEKRGGASGAEENSTELRQKLDTAMRVATLKKKEAQKLATKVEEMLREETRLRMEVAKLQLEVKQARAGAPAKPGTPGTGQKKAG